MKSVIRLQQVKLFLEDAGRWCSVLQGSPLHSDNLGFSDSLNQSDLICSLKILNLLSFTNIQIPTNQLISPHTHPKCVYMAEPSFKDDSLLGDKVSP